MAGIAFEKKIFDELTNIKAELNEIKEHMVDADTILTDDERMLISESFKHEKEGKLVFLSEFKKDLDY